MKYGNGVSRKVLSRTKGRYRKHKGKSTSATGKEVLRTEGIECASDGMWSITQDGESTSTGGHAQCYAE